jgi:hypothetical protein
VGISSEFEYDLIGKVILGGHNGQNYAARLFHIRLDHILNKLNIHSQLLFGFRMNKSREVNDGQIGAVGA